MSNHVYTSSLIWWLITGASDFASMLGPYFVAIGVTLWAFRARSLSSFVALIGGALVATARTLHIMNPSVRTIALGGMQPAFGENPVIVFFYLHGMPFGYFLIGLALIGTYAKGRPNNSFKPNLLRYTNNVAGKACHVVGSTTQVGLTQVLGR